MNKKGKFAVQVLVMLTLIVITSAVVFSLVQSGVIEVKEKEEVSIIDMEFIPYTREGSLVVKEFKFCEYVDENHNCVREKKDFKVGAEIYFRFLVESSTVNGEVMVVENYRLKGPDGTVLLEVDEKYDNYLESISEEVIDQIYFKDYIVSEEGDERGRYTLELFIENPLLNKKVTLNKGFRIV